MDKNDLEPINKEPMYKIFTHEDASIRYTDQGKGKIVVLLHGYLESLEVYSNFSRELSKVARVITLDLPGHGESDLVHGECSMETMASTIAELVNHLKLEKINLWGHSMGGYAALAFAERHPKKLEGLCLIHSTPNPDTQEKRVNRKREIELIKQGRKESICRTSIPNTFAKQNRETFAHEVERIIAIACKTKDEGVVAALNSMMSRPDQNDMLRTLEVNKSCIIGKKDDFIPFKKALQTAKETGLKPYILEDSGHMGFIEEQDECLDICNKILCNL